MRNRREWRNRVFVVMLVLAGLFSVSLGVGHAVPQQVGPYLVEVDVRTSLHVLIPQAVIECQLSGPRIRIMAYAPGYLLERKNIAIRPGVMTYAAALVLRDPPKRFDVYDFEHKPIASCFFDRDQGGTPPDQYAINMMIPMKSWPHPSPKNVIVNQPGYGWPVQNSCEISIREEFYRVRMLIDRAVLDDPHDELLILVNIAEIISPAAAVRWIDQIRRLEATSPAAATVLAKALLGSLPPGLDGSALPVSLARLLAAQNRFEDLHRGFGTEEMFRK